MTGLFFLCCFLPLRRHFALCDQTTGLHRLSLPPATPFCGCSKGTSPISFIFPYRNPACERGKQPVPLPEGTSLPWGQKLSPKAEGVLLNDKAPLKAIPVLQMLLPPADFPKGLHLAAVHAEGQAAMAAQAVRGLFVDQSVGWLGSVLTQTEGKRGRAQHSTALRKRGAGSWEADGKNPSDSNSNRIWLWILAPYTSGS